jgi:hypothetical protein
MKAVFRRVGRLEDRFVPGSRGVLRIVVTCPPMLPDGTAGYLPLAETRRLCLSQMRERRLQQQKLQGEVD